MNLIRYWEPCFEPSSPLTFGEMLDTLRSFQLLQCLLQAGPVGWDGLHALIYSSEPAQTFRLPIEIFAMRDTCLASRIRAVLEICFLTDLGVTGRPIDNVARMEGRKFGSTAPDRSN
jgi:hypothetical protein